MHRIFNLELLVLRCDKITEQATLLQNIYYYATNKQQDTGFT